jgi:hypothetical protein
MKVRVLLRREVVEVRLSAMYRMRGCSNHEEKVLRMKHLLAISLRSLGSINKRFVCF